MVSGTYLCNGCEPGHRVIQAFIPHIQEFEFKRRVQCTKWNHFT